MANKINLFLKAICNNIYLDKYVNTLFLANDPNWNAIVSPVKFSSYRKKYPKTFRVFYVFFIIFLPLIVFFKITYDLFKVTIFYFKLKNRKINKNSLEKGENLVLFSDSNVLHAIDKGFISHFRILTLPCTSIDFDEKKYGNSISSLALLSPLKILYYYLLSCTVIFFVILRYGYKNSLYAALSFEWLMFYDVLNNMNDKNRQLYFSNQKDRWAILYDNVSFEDKILVQHGTNIIKVINSDIEKFFKVSDNYNSRALIVPIRYNSIKTLIAFTAEEAEHIIVGEFNVPPEQVIYMGYNIKITNYVRKNEKTLVLLIGNVNAFYNQEQRILDKLDFRKYELLIKPHPLSEIEMCNSIYGRLATVTNNPDADVVISYNSTLAYEYISLGFNVYIYDTVNDAENIVLKLNGAECFQ